MALNLEGWTPPGQGEIPAGPRAAQGDTSASVVTAESPATMGGLQGPPEAFRTDVVGKIAGTLGRGIPEILREQATGGGGDPIGNLKAGAVEAIGGGQGIPADVRDPSGFRASLGNIANVLLPGSWEELATQAALGLPGKGLAPSLMRSGAAIGAPMAVAGLKGEDPLNAGFNAALQVLPAEGIGGIARATTRGGAQAIGGPRDIGKLADFIGSRVPEFRGATPGATIGNIVSQTGVRALQRRFDAAENRLLNAMPGAVRIPSLTAFPGLRIPGRNGVYPTQEALTAIKSIEATLAPDLPNTPNAGVDKFNIRKARQEFEGHIPPTALQEYQLERQHYRQGMKFAEMFGGGQDKTTANRLQEIIPSGAAARRGRPDWGTLQAHYQTNRQDFLEAFGPHGVQQMDKVMRYDPLNPLPRDVSGQGPKIGATTSAAIPRPYVHGFPRTPTRTGISEPIASVAAHTGRQLGARVPAALGMSPGLVSGEEAPEVHGAIPSDVVQKGKAAFLRWLTGTGSPLEDPGIQPERLSEVQRLLNQYKGQENPERGATGMTPVPRPGMMPRL